MENLAQASQLVNTTNSQGWQVIIALGERLITAAERAAIDCEDETKVVGLAREAKASRKFFDALLNTIDAVKNPELQQDSFIEVSY